MYLHRKLLLALMLSLSVGWVGRAASPPPADDAPHRVIRTIVLDPGHGGDEEGAVGPSGLYEKAVTLDLARRLKAILEEIPGITVLLTRDDDQEVDLWERPAIANRARAHLFVSIHANGSNESVATGVETFFMSLDAPDEDARRLAAIENGVVNASASPDDVKDDLQSILWTMAQGAFLEESQILAEKVQLELNRALKVPNRGVKQAPFVVLRNATMPAVLIEVGFISNPDIERRLKDPEYLDLVARAIADGIQEYRQIYER